MKAVETFAHTEVSARQIFAVIESVISSCYTWDHKTPLLSKLGWWFKAILRIVVTPTIQGNCITTTCKMWHTKDGQTKAFLCLIKYLKNWSAYLLHKRGHGNREWNLRKSIDTFLSTTSWYISKRNIANLKGNTYLPTIQSQWLVKTYRGVKSCPSRPETLALLGVIMCTIFPNSIT